MLLDAQNLFSQNQAITSASCTSDNIVAFGTGDISYLPVVIQVAQDFNNIESLTVAVETSKMPDFSSSKMLVQSTLPLDDLKEGKKFPISHMPKGNEGYIRLNYTTSGSIQATEGKITAGITAGNEFSFQDM